MNAWLSLKVVLSQNGYMGVIIHSQPATPSHPSNAIFQVTTLYDFTSIPNPLTYLSQLQNTLLVQFTSYIPMFANLDILL